MLRNLQYSCLKGVSNWAPYWQFHFGREGAGFELGTLLAVLFWEGGGQVLIWVPYWQFHFGREEGQVSNWVPYWQFCLGGRVHLQVDWKSVRFMDSDWLSTLPRADSCAKKSLPVIFTQIQSLLSSVMNVNLSISIQIHCAMMISY